MTYTYDLATDIGKVRLLIGDTDVEDTGSPPQSNCVFADEEIQVFLDDEVTAYRAAATALRAIASSKARLAHRLTLGDFTKDTTTLARELRATADSYDQKDSETPADAVAEEAVDDFALRQIVRNASQRSSL